jgi:hypothetical protein
VLRIVGAACTCALVVLVSSDESDMTVCCVRRLVWPHWAPRKKTSHAWPPATGSPSSSVCASRAIRFVPTVPGCSPPLVNLRYDYYFFSSFSGSQYSCCCLFVFFSFYLSLLVSTSFLLSLTHTLSLSLSSSVFCLSVSFCFSACVSHPSLL